MRGECVRACVPWCLLLVYMPSLFTPLALRQAKQSHTSGTHPSNTPTHLPRPPFPHMLYTHIYVYTHHTKTTHTHEPVSPASAAPPLPLLPRSVPPSEQPVLLRLPPAVRCWPGCTLTAVPAAHTTPGGVRRPAACVFVCLCLCGALVTGQQQE